MAGNQPMDTFEIRADEQDEPICRSGPSCRGGQRLTTAVNLVSIGKIRNNLS